MFDLKEQVAVVTGASRGIGRDVALQLAECGADLVLAARTEDALRELADEIAKMGRRAAVVPMDLSNRDQIRERAPRLLEEAGRVDILVNNAGITRDGLMMRMKDEDWDSVLATNLNSVFHLTRALLPTMIRQRYGRIVNVVSVVAMMGNPGQANYVASKAGVVGLTKSLAREVASRKITVNAVAPGFIETDMTAGLPEKARQQMLESIPLGLVGSARDVSSGVCFLASKEAGYITGHVLNINGGMYM